ncbi:hypothetical protein [Paraflavitalea soli]|uniref:hypothetical protein n=1 Tax=Paraflavitalea soli TaxID=2315862 RepID=UPI0013C468E3|nr:hypothetical protein [Paraflavitalea soli]
MPLKNENLPEMICVIILVLIMVHYVQEKNNWGEFCVCVALLYAIINGQKLPNK